MLYEKFIMEQIIMPMCRQVYRLACQAYFRQFRFAGQVQLYNVINFEGLIKFNNYYLIYTVVHTCTYMYFIHVMSHRNVFINIKLSLQDVRQKLHGMTIITFLALDLSTLFTNITVIVLVLFIYTIIYNEYLRLRPGPLPRGGRPVTKS